MVFIPGGGPPSYSPSIAPAGTGPDLTPAERQIERLMDDACRIFVNTGADRDAVLDQNTGELVQAGPNDLYVGKCTISGVGPGAATERAHQTEAVSSPMLSLPLSWLRAHPESEPPRGATVLITGCRRDPRLVGVRYTITDVELKTFAVSRRCALELRGDTE